MKNIKDTTKKEREARLAELKEKRKPAVNAYARARITLEKIDLEILQIEQANLGHFIEYEK